MCSLQTKNQAIKEAIAKTKNRRKSQVCRTFEVKVIGNKLSQEKKEHFNALFREAKWLRNAVIGSGDPFAFDSATKSVPVKRGDIFEEATFTAISAQMKQNIVDSVKSEIYGLATKKRKGEKVGALRFKAFCNSIPLRQYGMTYRVDFVNNTVIIQNLKKPVKVRGLGQIPKDAEIASAKFVRKPSGLYFHITTYCEVEAKEPTGAVCGIDFGVAANLTLD